MQHQNDFSSPKAGGDHGIALAFKHTKEEKKVKCTECFPKG
jgi:hypothetical protein